MDKRIRKNELCIIGLPRCDFVFSSTRSCFIGYGFAESALEMTILKHLLSERGIEPFEAAGSLAAGQNAFCAKICSKVITSQFCAILLNDDTTRGVPTPSANVCMEYGLMLGFNKYIIPFQRQSQELPFNVASLDTVKYTAQDFETKAAAAIDQAIGVTTQDSAPLVTPDQILEAFLLSQQVLVVPINTDGDRNLYELGRPLGFNMLMTFDGMQYRYFGNFTALRPEVVLWRLATLNNILQARFGSIPERVKLGLATQAQLAVVQSLLSSLQIWLLVNSDDQKSTIERELSNRKIPLPVRLFSMSDIKSTLEGIKA
ncbi:MAG: hypothetical protein WBW69_02120 [Candidatus Korobacteraceae bacterium]